MIAELETYDVDHKADIMRLCRSTSEGSSQPMVAVEGTTHIISYLNPAFALLVGRRREELVGRLIMDAVPEGPENGCLALRPRFSLWHLSGFGGTRTPATAGAHCLLVVRCLGHFWKR